jgi:hypothetical protein
VTAQQLRDAARLIRDGHEVPEYVVDALGDAVRVTLGVIRLPDAVSPFGHFGVDVHEDLLNGWIESKLLPAGGMLKLLDKAKDVAGFQFMAEQNFYQWLLNARPRSYASNLYRRMVEKLAADPHRFHVVHEANKRQHRGWALVEQGTPAMFAGSDRELTAAAMAAGEIPVVRWSPDSKNLDPLISSNELMRFCEVVMRTLQAGVTAEMLMRALATRLDLADAAPQSLEELADAGEEVPDEDVDVDEELDLRPMAINVIARITNPRQAEVIVATERRGEAGKDVAERLGVSPATVTADRKAVILLVIGFAENRGAASRLLKEVVDLLYEACDGP